MIHMIMDLERDFPCHFIIHAVEDMIIKDRIGLIFSIDLVEEKNIFWNIRILAPQILNP